MSCDRGKLSKNTNNLVEHRGKSGTYTYCLFMLLIISKIIISIMIDKLISVFESRVMAPSNCEMYVYTVIRSASCGFNILDYMKI